MNNNSCLWAVVLLFILLLTTMSEFSNHVHASFRGRKIQKGLTWETDYGCLYAFFCFLVTSLYVEKTKLQRREKKNYRECETSGTFIHWWWEGKNSKNYSGKQFGSLQLKNMPAIQETQVQFLGWEDPLEKEMATYSSIFAWRLPGTEEPGRLYSPWGHKSQMQLSD